MRLPIHFDPNIISEVVLCGTCHVGFTKVPPTSLEFLFTVKQTAEELKEESLRGLGKIISSLESTKGFSFSSLSISERLILLEHKSWKNMQRSFSMRATELRTDALKDRGRRCSIKSHPPSPCTLASTLVTPIEIFDSLLCSCYMWRRNQIGACFICQLCSMQCWISA